MVAAADAVLLAIAAYGTVENVVELWQAAQNVAGKPGEGLAPAQPACGRFQVAISPGMLEGPPRCRETLAQERRSAGLPPCLRPECRQERRETPFVRPACRAFRQGGKQALISYLSLLVSDVAV